MKNPDLNGMPQLSLGDVIDKMSILTRKTFFGEEEAFNELQYLVDCLDNECDGLGSFTVAVIRLSQMNFEVWNRENKYRRDEDDEPYTNEEKLLIAQNYVEVRKFNRKRVRYKNEINDVSGKGFREFKIKHRSQ